MGDGRYYTPLQFFNTLILLALLMFITMNIVTILYKHIRDKRSNQLIGLYVALCVTVLLRVAEEVVASEGLIVLLKVAGNWLLGAISLGILWVIGCLIRQTLKGKIPLIHEYGSDALLKVIWMFLVPLAIYSFIIFLGQPWVKHYQLVFYGVLSYTLNSLLNLIAPYGISRSLFTTTKDMILDYVFITDVHDTIIYQNNNSETVSYFNPVRTLNGANITAIFNRAVEHQQLRGKHYIKYVGDEGVLYFSYDVKPLLRRGITVGAIITFTDVSGLMTLLSDLDQKNADKVRINKELEEYATIVYRLEKEKEIQQLLESIAENQEKSMLGLKEDILKAMQRENQLGIMSDLETMIVNAKENLRDVRDAVNTFSAYYGGKDD